MAEKEINRKLRFFNVLGLILFAIFFIIPLIFFLLLSFKTGSEFGLKEISFSVVISVLATIFLLWTKTLIKRNPYLGSIIGLSVLGATQYALFFEYQGELTIIFSIIVSIIVVLYLGINFFKTLEHKSSKKETYFEDNFSK